MVSIGAQFCFVTVKKYMLKYFLGQSKFLDLKSHGVPISEDKIGQFLKVLFEILCQPARESEILSL